MGAGLSLLLSAGTTLLQPLGWTAPNAGDNLIWALFAFLALVVTQRTARFPYALLVFAFGLVLSFFIAGRTNLPSFEIWHPVTFLPSRIDFKRGALEAGFGQIPLTTLNSIIAVTYLAADLLPHIPTPGVTAIGVSVAVMNLIGGWFGAMPVCHGSGGLAAQYRFGARSGASIIFLGLFKMVFGFFFGEQLVGLLRVYPKSLLGVMVLAAGLELAKVGESLNYGARDLWEVSDSALEDESAQVHTKNQRQLTDGERMDRWTVMFMTIGGLIAFKNDGVGFVAGMLCHCALQSSNIGIHWREWKIFPSRRATSIEEEEQLLPEH